MNSFTKWQSALILVAAVALAAPGFSASGTRDQIRKRDGSCRQTFGVTANGSGNGTRDQIRKRDGSRLQTFGVTANGSGNGTRDQIRKRDGSCK